MTDTYKPIRDFALGVIAQRDADVAAHGRAGAANAIERAVVAHELLILLDGLPAPPADRVPLTEATRKRIRLLVDRYAGAKVGGELAYARDAGPLVLARHDAQEKKAWDELDAELDKLAEAAP